MAHAAARRGIGGPFLALLFLLALAHNWAGITDAYFALWNWLGAEIAHALVPSATS